MQDELAQIRSTEVRLGPPCDLSAKPADALKVTFILQYFDHYRRHLQDRLDAEQRRRLAAAITAAQAA